MRSLSRAVRRDLQREFPHDRRSEADEQSHFFYLLILIRGCLERSLPLSLPPSRPCARWLPRLLLPRGWLVLPYVARSFPRFLRLYSRLTVLINRASCTMPVAAVAASHSVVSLFPLRLFRRSLTSASLRARRCTLSLARAALSGASEHPRRPRGAVHGILLYRTIRRRFAPAPPCLPLSPDPALSASARAFAASPINFYTHRRRCLLLHTGSIC